MSNIEQQAIEKFNENLLYFEKKHPELFKKLSLLNLAIQNGSYTEKYALDYKENYFDVLELASNTYLYSCNSTEHAKELAKQINFKKSEGVIESFYNQNITQKQVDYYDGNVPIDGPLWAAAKIINYTNSVKSKNDEMKTIDKFVFSGVGLGIHLLTIQHKISASYLFIIEDNLELFRLSLFVTPYYILANNTELTFSVMQNNREFRVSFESFFVKAYNYNHYIKYSVLSSTNIKHIKTIQSYIVSAQFLSFPYTSQLKELLKAPEYLIQGYPFVDFSSIHENKLLDSKPVLLIASGPSLGNNIEWLKENQDKFIIIAVLSSIKTLNKHNIKPNIVINIDASTRSPRLLEGVDVKEFFNQTLLILSSVVTRKLIDSFEKKNTYCFETASDYKKGFNTLTAPSVGESAYAVSLLLGTKELYLLGLDLALDPETNLTHSQEHHDSRKLTHSSKEDDNYMKLNDSTVKIKGNFLPEVLTLPVYQTSIEGFNRFTERYLTNNQKVYNLNNGAYLEGTIPLHVEDVDVNSFKNIDKNSTYNELKKILNTISEDKLNQKDISNLKQQLNEAKRLGKYVQEFKSNVNTSNYSIYMQSFYTLSSELISIKNEEKLNINIVLYTYLVYVTGHIFNLFNTKDLKNIKRHMKKINKIFTEEIMKILNLYITTMEVYLEFAEAQNKKD